MAQELSSGIWRTFELPNGIEIDGKLYKSGRMKKVRNRQLINLQEDPNLRGLSKSQTKINLESPASSMIATGAMYAVFCSLFTKLVVFFVDGSEGGEAAAESQLNPTVGDFDAFAELYAEDMELLVDLYGEMNMTAEQRAKVKAKGTPSPLVGSAPSES